MFAAHIYEIYESVSKMAEKFEELTVITTLGILYGFILRRNIQQNGEVE